MRVVEGYGSNNKCSILQMIPAYHVAWISLDQRMPDIARTEQYLRLLVST